MIQRMNIMKTKLIAFDLDDTLLDREKKLPAENEKAMREAAASRWITRMRT